MSFAARGIPIHTRSLSTTLREAPADDASFSAYVLDLRKRGAVPVGGDIQGPGIIHHMLLDGLVDRSARRYRSIEARMPTVAFEPAPGTRGESCRDRIGNVLGLAGLPLDDDYARGVGTEIGGVLGCSHVLTLAQLMGPSIRWGLDVDERSADTAPRGDGERIFRRDVTVDGFVEGDNLLLVAQLNDLHFRAAAVCESAPDLLGAQTEVRVQGTLSLQGMQISDVFIEERRRTLETLDSAPWRPRPDRTAFVEGERLSAGISSRLVQAFGTPGDDRPLLDTLLMLAPATIQCLASYRDSWTQLGGSKLAETGGHADSCYMWRTGGALQARRNTDQTD